MPALRCTQRLLRRMRHPVVEPVTPPENALGHWYANILTIRRTPLVLAVSEHSLLSVIVPGAPFNTLPDRVIQAVGELLPRLGIRGDLITREIDAMTPLQVAPTASRQVLGCLNRFAFDLELNFEYHPERSLMERQIWMAEEISTVTGYRLAREVAADLLTAKWGGWRGPSLSQDLLTF